MLEILTVTAQALVLLIDYALVLGFLHRPTSALGTHLGRFSQQCYFYHQCFTFPLPSLCPFLPPYRRLPSPSPSLVDFTESLAISCFDCLRVASAFRLLFHWLYRAVGRPIGRGHYQHIVLRSFSPSTPHIRTSNSHFLLTYD